MGTLVSGSQRPVVGRTASRSLSSTLAIEMVGLRRNVWEFFCSRETTRRMAELPHEDPSSYYGVTTRPFRLVPSGKGKR